MIPDEVGAAVANNFHSQLLYAANLAQAELEHQNKIIRVTNFNGSYKAVDKNYVFSQLAMPALSDLPYEVWVADSNLSISYSRTDLAEVALAGELTLIKIVAPEGPIAQTETESRWSSSIAEAAYSAYSRLFRVITSHNLGKIVRIWNYIPNIIQLTSQAIPQEDRERYRQFNAGRQAAWAESGPRAHNGQPTYPAATGVGSYGGPLIVECLVSHQPVHYIDNPRQTPPYQYPAKYGTKAPAFARGSLHLPKSGPEFYISGTGSIVKSETIHKDDPQKQVREIFLNIQALISNQNLLPYGKFNFELQDLTGVRVYIKNRDHYAMIRQEVERTIGSHRPIIYLNNDICRHDLALEIEGLVVRR